MIEIEDLLKDGDMNVQGRLIDASNATLVVTITHGDSTTQAIYKPIAGERPLWDFQDGNLASRERAAYILINTLGFNLVPLTILRYGPFGLGMVQRWVEIDSSIDLEQYFRARTPALRQVVLFDAIINNTDRKIGHLLPDADGNLFVCDHGVTFHEEDKLRTVLWQWSGEELSLEEISTLEDLLDDLATEKLSELQKLITTSEYEALVFRVRRLIDESTFPIPNPEWPAIPWPPF